MYIVYHAVVVKYIYVGDTTRRLEQRVKVHQDACKRGDEKVLAIAYHAGINITPLFGKR